MTVTIQNLRAFLAVGSVLNFTRAAAELGLSQPALTMNVRQLEDELGVSLFDRTTRSVAMTAEGAQLLPMARSLVEEFDNTVTDMRHFGERRRGSLVIACPEGVAVRIVVPVIRTFAELYPGITVNLLDGDANSVRLHMRDREADLGVSGYWEDTPDYVFEPFTEDCCCLVCRRDDPLAGMEEPRLGDLKGRPFLSLNRNAGVRRLIDREALRMGVRLNRRFEIARLSTLLGLVEAGLGVTVLPKLAIPSIPANLHVRPLRDQNMSYPIGIITRRGKALSPAAASFRSALMEHFRDAG